MKKILTIVAVAVIIVGGYFLLNKGQESPGSRSLKVGVIVPLTGSISAVGEDFLNGLLLAKEQAGSNVELFIEDSQSDAKSGVSAAKKILDTKDPDVLVSLQSAVVMPILSLAEQYKKPLIATAISKNEFAEQSIYSFRLFQSANQEAAEAARYANAKKISKIYTLVVNDEYGLSVAEHFKKNFNGEIVSEEAFNASNYDFRTLLIKIPDNETIFFIGYAPHCITFFKQINELGKKVMVISNENLVSNIAVTQLGSLLTNAVVTMPASMISIRDEGNKFRKDYEQKYKVEPDWVAPFGYDMMLVLNAIQESHVDPLEALKTLQIKNGINSESLSFDDIGEAYIPLTIAEVDKGVIRELDVKK